MENEHAEVEKRPGNHSAVYLRNDIAMHDGYQEVWLHHVPCARAELQDSHALQIENLSLQIWNENVLRTCGCAMRPCASAIVL